jgi:CDP-6-deoxy-D-xylo-4-hexulose-3-dehydrase
MDNIFTKGGFKIKDGDRIGFSALTWSANTMPFIQMGLIAVPI